jgi:hypothetical protein
MTNLTARLDVSAYLQKLGNMAAMTGQEMQALMKQEATLFIYNSGKIPGVINITPPFSSRSKDSASALLSAQRSIDRDLSGVFAPVTLKGKRTITHLFGKTKVRAGNPPPYTVTTKEKHPDVAAIVKKRWDAKNRGISRRMTRGQKSAYYVDAIKLSIVRKESRAMIGLAAASWYQAAVSSGLTPRGVPAWVTRHSSAFGAGFIRTSATSITIQISSRLPYNTALGMQGKAVRVLGYRQGALERRLPYIIKALAKKAQLK